MRGALAAAVLRAKAAEARAASAEARVSEDAALIADLKLLTAKLQRGRVSRAIRARPAARRRGRAIGLSTLADQVGTAATCSNRPWGGSRPLQRHRPANLQRTLLGAWSRPTARPAPTQLQARRALRHSLAGWPALTGYVDNGRIQFDNNLSGRALRSVARGGRINFLFSRFDPGGEGAAVIYILTETAKLRGVNSSAWVPPSSAVSDITPFREINEFFPWARSPRRARSPRDDYLSCPSI